MNRIKFYQKVLLILFMFCYLTSYTSKLQAQGPNAPEAASFEPVDVTDMVNFVTGDFTYVLPLLNVPSPQGGFPVALSYHAGISSDQEASWVGLGWNLNTGAINRSLVGVPDDHHNFKKQDVYYNLLDEYSDFSVDVSYGGKGTLGGSLSYSTHKGFGGSVSFANMGGVEYNESDGFGVGLNLFSSSIKTPAYSKSISGDLSYNFKNKSLNFEFTGSYGVLNASTGFSISTVSGASSGNGVGISFAGASINGGSGIRGQVNTSFSGWSIPIPILTTGVVVTISKGVVKQWVYTNDLNYSVGSIAFTHDFDVYENQQSKDKYSGFQGVDVIMQPNDPYELGPGHGFDASKISDDALEEINFPAYDKYVVNSQGISGDFSLKYYNNFNLPIAKSQFTAKASDNDATLTKRREFLWDKVSEIKPYFYFNHEFSSYLELSKSNINGSPVNDNSHWNLDELSSNNSITNTTLYSSLLTETNSYNSSKKRKRTGNFITSYTKNDVINNNSLFKYATNNGEKLNYDEIFENTNDTEYSIIGFSITAVDGKIYHYSLPVYQKEMISKIEKKTNPNDKFNEVRNFSNYATHWLLTSITAPDYIDINNNNIPDSGDYGFWVRFEHGKWSDGFGWESDSKESVSFENCSDPINNPEDCDEVSYISKTFGVKEVYYLNKIITRSHTALFLKELRNDLEGVSLNEGNSKLEPKVYNNVRKSMITNDYPKISSGIFHSYYSFKRQKNLRLAKIIVIKNKNDVYTSDGRPKEPIEGGEFYFYEKFTRYNFLGQLVGEEESVVHETNWKGEMYNNVLEVDDVNLNILEAKSTKNADFHYNYELGNKLSLSYVGYSSRGGEKVIPDYNFSYYQGTFGKADTDKRWGYHKTSPERYSLKKIINPLGAEINITYESDQYKSLENDELSSNFIEGGIRVKGIRNNDKKTTYSYSDGISSYRPEEIVNSTYSFKNYKSKIFEIPPQVFYKKVTEHNSLGFVEYEFDLPTNKLEKSNFLSHNVNLNAINETVDKTFFNKSREHKIKTNSSLIKDNTAAFGRLLDKKVYNSVGHLLTSTTNIYRPVNSVEKQGVSQETFSSFKKTSTWEVDRPSNIFDGYDYFFYGNEYSLISSSKITYPNVLIGTKTVSNGVTKEKQINKFDFLTGEPIETIIFKSDKVLKSKRIPAYLRYSAMGSKVDNPNNKNMLSQQAASYIYLLDEANSTEKVISAGISTWNNDWTYRNESGIETTPVNDVEKIWRKHKSFFWKGDIDSDGAYVGFNDNNENDDGFVWGLGLSQTNEKWKQASETTLYDHFSAPLERMDINNNYASTKMCDDESKVMSVSNAKYTEMYYSGAEYIVNDVRDPNLGYFDGEVKSVGQSSGKAHTGTKSIAIASGQNGFEINLKNGEHRAGKYKVSVWVDKGSEANAQLIVGTNTYSFQDDGFEQIPAGDWVLLNKIVDIPVEATIVAVTSASGTIYFDDFRLMPIASSMSSYVYNEWDELWYIIGANGLATRYEYDSSGRLKKTFTEVVDNGSIAGGFKQVSNHNYNYKLLAQYDTDGNGQIDESELLEPMLVSLDAANGISNPGTLSTTVSGGSGDFRYSWSEVETTLLPTNVGDVVFGNEFTSNTRYISDIPCSDNTVIHTLIVTVKVRDVVTEKTSIKPMYYNKDCGGGPGEILPEEQ